MNENVCFTYILHLIYQIVKLNEFSSQPSINRFFDLKLLANMFQAQVLEIQDGGKLFALFLKTERKQFSHEFE